MENSVSYWQRMLMQEIEEVSYEKSGLENPDKADRDKDKDISSWEKKVGSAIEKNMEEDISQRIFTYKDASGKEKFVTASNPDEAKEKVKKFGGDVNSVKEKSAALPVAPKKSLGEYEDHEVSMANNSLETIIKHAMDLKSKLGNEEKDIPAWIQDHITNAANFISQAAENYHEYGDHEGEELAENISITIPEDTDYKEFASEVANILKKDYGEHNFQPFIKALSDELSKQDDMTEQLSLEEMLKNIKNGHK